MHIDCIVRIERHLFLVKLAEVQMVRIFKTAIVIFGSRTDIENIPILEIADELSRRYIFICIVVVLLRLIDRNDQLQIVIADGSEILLQRFAVLWISNDCHRLIIIDIPSGKLKELVIVRNVYRTFFESFPEFLSASEI